MQFYSKGSPVFVRVNNSFSVGPFSGYKFAHPGTSDTLWAMVMEKAFAWFRTGANTYCSIDTGLMSEAYTALGVRSNEFAPWDLSDDQLYSMFANGMQKSEAITLASDPSALDVVSGHTYTLIGVKKVNGVNEYVLRNPWGTAGDSLETSRGIATLTYDQLIENYEEGVIAVA